MHVLGKYELDDCVRYDELELLLSNLGVPKSSTPVEEPEVLKEAVTTT